MYDMRTVRGGKPSSRFGRLTLKPSVSWSAGERVLMFDPKKDESHAHCGSRVPYTSFTLMRNHARSLRGFLIFFIFRRKAVPARM